MADESPEKKPYSGLEFWKWWTSPWLMGDMYPRALPTGLFSVLLMATGLLYVVARQSLVIFDRAEAAEFPAALDHEEDYLLVHSWRMARGESYVKPLWGTAHQGDPPEEVADSSDFIVGTYMPLVPWLASVGMNDGAPSLSNGRIVAFYSACACAILLLFCLVRLVHVGFSGIPLAMLFLLSRDVLKWLPLYRVDFTALALALGGLWVLSWINLKYSLPAPDGDRIAKRVRWTRFLLPLFFATALFLAAGFAKQTMVAAPTAAFIWLAWRVGVKFALGWAAASGLAGGLIYLMIALRMEGNFWFHTFTANANQMSGEQLFIWARHYFLFNRWLIVAALVGALFAGGLHLFLRNNKHYIHPKSNSPTDLFSIYAILAIATFLGAAKLGAAENYMLEPTIGLLLAIGCALSILERPFAPTSSEASTKSVLLHAIPLAIIFVLLFCHSFRIFNPFFSDSSNPPFVLLGVQGPSDADQRAALAIDGIVAADPEGTWCERAAFSLRHGAPLFLHPFICAQLAREGKWDESVAVAQLRQGRFRRLIITEDVRPEAFQSGDAQYTPAMRAAIQQRYTLDAIYPAHHFIYYVWQRSDLLERAAAEDAAAD